MRRQDFPTHAILPFSWKKRSSGKLGPSFWRHDGLALELDHRPAKDIDAHFFAPQHVLC